METLPFDAVLCDFDGVVHVWDPDGMNALDRAWGLGLVEGTLAGAAFEDELLRAAVTGRISDEEWRSRIADDLKPVCGSAERARELVSAWSALTGRVDPDVMALLTEVRRTVPVVLLSNAPTRLESYLAEIGLSESFDAVVNTAGHVVAAREAGLTGLHCQHVGQLRDAVAPLLRRG